MKAVTMHKTTDGAVFEDEKSAKDHQAAIDNADRINSFLDAHYPVVGAGAKQGPARTMAKTAVTRFIQREA